MSIITTAEQLDAIYRGVAPASTVKVAHRVTAEYGALIAASPFLTVATVGPEGLDCSPRGDRPGFVRIADPHTLMIPDRRGNNRIDTLRNVVRDPRVALLFLIPGSGTTLRVKGRAVLSVAPGLLESFAVEGQSPRTVMVVTVGEIYFQCARAVVRAGLWDPARHVDPATLPTPGQILASMTSGAVGGDAYDAAWPERAKATLW